MDNQDVYWEVVDWTDMVQDGDKLRAVVNTAMNLPVLFIPCMWLQCVMQHVQSVRHHL
jgi:hypothetical protein